MNFQLSDTVRLAGTPNEWQLQKLSVKKDAAGNKVPAWKSFKYYSSLSSALKLMGEYDFRMSADTADLTRRIDRLADVADRAAIQVREAVGCL